MSCRSDGMARATTGIRSVPSRYCVTVAPCCNVCSVVETASLVRPSSRALSWSTATVAVMPMAPQLSLTLRTCGEACITARTWPAMRRSASGSGPVMRNCTG